jgi:hypothetical protein
LRPEHAQQDVFGTDLMPSEAPRDPPGVERLLGARRKGNVFADAAANGPKIGENRPPNGVGCHAEGLNRLRRKVVRIGERRESSICN